jgi:hypothetical protein
MPASWGPTLAADNTSSAGGDATLDHESAPATIGTTPSGGTAALGAEAAATLIDDDDVALSASGATPAVDLATGADGEVKSLMCVSSPSDMRCYNCASLIYGLDFVKQGTYFKCGNCNRLASRIQRTLSKQHELKDSWNSLGKEEKKEFFRTNHEAMGTTLALAINESIKNSFRQTSRSTFEAEGSWHDETDVCEMFKSKPAQLDAVLKFAKTLQCPIRNVQLFEVLSYKSKAADEQESSRERAVSTSQSSSRKALKDTSIEPKEKKPKIDKAPTVLNDGSLAKLVKISDKLKEKLVIMGAMCRIGSDSQVPDKMIQNLGLRKASMEEAKSLVDIAIESKVGKVTDLTKQANQVNTDSIEAAKNVQTVLDALTDID